MQRMNVNGTRPPIDPKLIPVEWHKVMYRLMGLPSGRHMITIDLREKQIVSLTVMHLGKVETVQVHEAC